jgi:hypothetical protein
MKLVVDAAHGAAYHVAPDVFHELGATVVEIGCSPDGFNINLGVGATAPAALVQAVLDTCVLARIDLVNGTAATPYAQVVQLGQKLCPLFQLDTLFRGYLVDVAP